MKPESKIVETSQDNGPNADHEMPSWHEVFLYFFFLGFVNIGGPVAHTLRSFLCSAAQLRNITGSQTASY